MHKIYVFQDVIYRSGDSKEDNELICAIRYFISVPFLPLPETFIYQHFYGKLLINGNKMSYCSIENILSIKIEPLIIMDDMFCPEYRNILKMSKDNFGYIDVAWAYENHNKWKLKYENLENEKSLFRILFDKFNIFKK